MLHDVPQTTETMFLSWANPSALRLCKKYLAYYRIRGLPYLGANVVIVYLWVSAFLCWFLPSSGQVLPLLECIGYQKKLQYLVLIIHLSKLSLMAIFLCNRLPPGNFCHVLSHCQVPVHHQLFLQHPCSSHMFGQSSSQRHAGPSSTQKAFWGICIAKGV